MVKKNNVGVTKLNRLDQNRCRICKRVFCCETCRMKHENKIHNLTQDCEICITGKISAFSISSNLIDHLKNAHWPLHCVICQRLFGSVEEIFSHRKCPIRHSSPLINNTSSNSPVIYIGSGNKEYLSPFSPVETMQQFGLQHNVPKRVTSTPMQRNENIVFNKIAQMTSTPVEDSGDFKVHSKNDRLLPTRSSSLKRVTFSTSSSNKENDIAESTECNSLLYYSALGEELEEVADKLDKDNDITPSTPNDIKIDEVHSPPLTAEESPVEDEEVKEILSEEENKTLFVSAVDILSKDKIPKTMNNEPVSPPEANIQVTEVTESEIVALITANITQKVYIRHSEHRKANSSLHYSKTERLDQGASTSSAPDDPYFSSIRTDNHNIAETPVANSTSTDIATRQTTMAPFLLHVSHTQISPNPILNCEKAHMSDLLLYNDSSRRNYKVYTNDESKKSSTIWMNKIWESFNSLVRTMQRPFHDNDITPKISPPFTQTSVKRYSTDMDLIDDEHSAKRFKSTDIRGRPPIRPSVGAIEYFRKGFSDVKRFADKATQTYESDFISVDCNYEVD